MPLPPHEHPELDPLDLELLRTDPRACAMELTTALMALNSNRVREEDPAQEHRYERLMHLLGIATGHLLVSVAPPEPGSIVVHREPEHLRAELGALHGLAHAVRELDWIRSHDGAWSAALVTREKATGLRARLEAVDAVMKGGAT